MTGRPLANTIAEPYRLRSILRDAGIRQRELCERIRYESGARVGQTMAVATMSLLLTQQRWPVTIDRDSIITRTTDFLRERGIDDADIERAWDIDPQADAQANSSNQPHRRKDATPAPPAAALFQLPETEMLSPATREHFRLARHPFMDDVQGPQDVYLSKDQRYIRESMYYAAKHSGLLAVIGESGAGKSTLRRDLIDRIRRDNEPIAVIQPKVIDKRTLTAAHICDAIILDLSNERPRMSLEAKARQVERILSNSARAGNLHAMIIEEAHDLGNATLKYLKRFWELEDGFRKLIGIILVGQPELGDKLDERRNPDLREFIRRCEVATLVSLNGNLEEYLALKFRRVGATLDQVFDPDAFDAIRARLTRRRINGQVESHLYPLVVQNLIVKGMNEATELGLPRISGKLVEGL